MVRLDQLSEAERKHYEELNSVRLPLHLSI